MRLPAQGPLPARNYRYNETGAITGDGQKSYAYNLRGRLATLTTAAGITTYEHNGLGQRTAKTVQGTTTRFAYDEAGSLLGEYGASGTPIREYVWLGDTPVLMLAHTANQPPTIYLIHADQIDTPRLVQDAQYHNRWAWDPDGFGQLPPNENPAGLGPFVFNLRMPGQYYDAESGLFYNHFRDYDPGTGRYIASDPIGLAGGYNTYLYAFGGPLAMIDRYGLDVINLFSPTGEPDPILYPNSTKVPDVNGLNQVLVHGDPNNGTYSYIDKKFMDPNALAKKLIGHPKFQPQQPVVMGSCRLGQSKSYCQRLANILRVPVLCPSDYVWYFDDGSISIYGKSPDGKTPDTGDPGNLWFFNPQ